MALPAYASVDTEWLCPFALILAGAAVGAGLGLVTNFINGQVSTEYFQLVFGRWVKIPFLAALTHGLWEGGLLGLFCGFCLAVASAVITRLRADFASAAPALWLALSVATACWVVGGIIGLTWAAADPTSYIGAFPVARNANHLASFGWVGGSIWGGYAGGPVGVVVGSMWLWRICRRDEQRHARRGFGVIRS